MYGLKQSQYIASSSGIGSLFFQQKAVIGRRVQFTPFVKYASNNGTLFSIDATL
jgi:hypothetical protein